MKMVFKIFIGLIAIVGIAVLAPSAAKAVQVQFVNNTPAFTGYDLYWYMNDYYQCMAPSGYRTCSSEVSEGYYYFKVKDVPNDNAGDYLCIWELSVESGYSYTLTYPDDCE